jgi:O-antigen/teichoic acid export membrane protein
MINKIKSKTIQDLLKVLSGNIVAQGIGFLTIIFISRDLGPEQYGIFSLLLAIFTISVQVSDFGISTSYVKYLSENLSKSKEIFFTIMMSKIALSFISILLLCFLSDYISIFFFQTKIYSQIIEFISIAILFHSIFAIVVANYQAKQQFKYFVLMSIFHNLLKFLTILSISFLFIKEKHLVYFIYAYAYSLVVILFFLLIANYKDISIKRSFNFNHFIKIYKLGFWIFLSSLATMIMMRLDIMMLQKMSYAKEVGYYSVAMSLAMIFPLITTSLTTILLPKLDNYLRHNTIKEYITRILSKTRYIILLLIIFEIAAPFIINILFGEAYRNSIEVFQILLIAFLFGVIINPISIIIYKIEKAYIATLLNLIQILLNYFGNLLLIPLYHANGAAFSTVFLNLFGGIYLSIYIWKIDKTTIKKRKKC